MRKTKKKAPKRQHPNPENARDDVNVAKQNVKDCVFSDLFGNKKYLRELYLALHPEDTAITEDDLQDITIRNVLINDLYNDLGFRVGNRLIILVEAQSTWSVNIIYRALLYLATTYRDYTDANGYDMYSPTRIPLPKPELYVIYIGDRKERPDEILLSEEFFPGVENLCMEIKVKMIYGTGNNDILSQYVYFSKVYNEQRKLHGSTRKAVEETIRICKDADVLKEYLEQREKEVVTMMTSLFDTEQLMKNHDASIRREATEKATKKANEKAIITLVQTYKELNGTKENAIQKVIVTYDYSEDESSKLVEKYWNMDNPTLDEEADE